jgi:GNAT superfamily N-acetyltransferase
VKLVHKHSTYVASRLEDGRRDVLLHTLTACTAEGNEVARIVWHDTNGEIEKLFVDPQHRRKGLATSLFNMAQWLNPAPKHSAWRTDDGDAWAKSITNDLPERKYA